MTAYDELPFTAPEPEAARTIVPSPKRCRRHQWTTVHLDAPQPGRGTLWHFPHEGACNGTPGEMCARCYRPKDAALSRRGKSARRLGHDGERRSEKRYGWRKVGESGGIDDLIGRLFVVQQKTTRTAPPLRWKTIFNQLDSRAAGRIPLLLLSFVRHGVDTEDFILVRGRDWLALHGRDSEEDAR